LEHGVVSQGSLRASRPALARVLLAIIAVFAFLLPIAAEAASVPRKFAGIVVDAKSGKVLYESSADAARYPASITKVMTLYVLFQELNAGNIKLSDKMVVSKHAAAAVPTKLGLKAGSKIAVKDAILALVTLSANDIARVIAEHISGTESKFAERMTKTAHALGMNHTTYRNASGLPDSKQITTVRDQALLGVAIYQHFPDYYEYFQTKAFKYGKRTYGNHNRLLGERGIDGIKTGYTRASGFNLLTAARQNGHHIVVAGFGFESSGGRDAKIRELVKKYLSKSRTGGYLDVAMVPVPGRKGAVVQVAAADPVVPMPYPTFRLDELGGAQESAVMVAAVTAEPELSTDDPVATAGIGDIADDVPVPMNRPLEIGLVPAVEAAAVMSGVIEPQERPLDVIGAWLSDTFTLGAPPAPLGETQPSAPIVPPVGMDEAGEPIDLMTSGSVEVEAVAMVEQPAPAEVEVAAVAAEPALVEPKRSGWVVQIGAAPSETGAQSLLSDAAGTVAKFGNYEPYVERLEKNGQIFFRARFAGFGDREAATAMCNELKKAKMSCLAMQS
jgi:D-alanyl-D-alanine carboxypeptidase